MRRLSMLERLRKEQDTVCTMCHELTSDCCCHELAFAAVIPGTNVWDVLDEEDIEFLDCNECREGDCKVCASNYLFV